MAEEENAEYQRQRDERRREREERFGDRGGYDNGPRGGGFGGGGRYNDRGGGYNRDELPRGPRGAMDELPRGPRGGGDFGQSAAANSRLDSLLKPKARDQDENMLMMPKKDLAPEHAGNVLQMPTKKSEEKAPEKAPEPEPIG